MLVTDHESQTPNHEDQEMTVHIRPPVKWHGGKKYLAKRIIDLFPSHHTYLEPFGGAASVLLNKKPSPVEIYNDLDERITRLFRVLRNNGEELRRRLVLSPYSELEFNNATTAHGDEIEQARRDYIRWRLSFGGKGQNFSFTKHRERRGMADVVSGYLSAIDDQLPVIIDRLRTVQIMCRPACDLIREWDSPDTLVYADPPYVLESRAIGCRNVYGHEMSDQDHRDLAVVLKSCQAKVILSGYPSELYDELYSDWRLITFDMPNHASGNATKRQATECLWLNWQ